MKVYSNKIGFFAGKPPVQKKDANIVVISTNSVLLGLYLKTKTN